MFRNKIYRYLAAGCVFLMYAACKLPTLVKKTENTTVPATYNNVQDSVNTGQVNWKEYFTDPYLAALVDTALQNNQELNITLQEIEIARNEIRARKGEYL